MGLSKEEKKARKEAKKLEKLRQEAEERKQLKREELKREIAAQAARRSELDKSWREMMLKIKEPVFRQDIEVMWHVFERLYDKKDHLIVHTIQLMNVADDQFQRTVASFCDIIDGMINKFLSDLDDLCKNNDHVTRELLQRTDDETSNIMSDHNAAETHLHLLLFHAHNTADSLAWTKRGENLVKLDEERSKFNDERENLKSFLENVYNATWDEYKAILKAYILDTAENQKKVRKLRRKENLMADIIASQTKKIANGDGLLRRLRSELSAYESGTKQAVFRDRRNRHRDACYRLKKNIYDGVHKDTKQLALLVKESTAAEEWLQAAFQKVEKILRLTALCRKYETQKEKVLPFGTCIPHSPIDPKPNGRRNQSDDTLVMDAIASTRGFTRLWHRMSKAELTKKALYREKLLLEQENAYFYNQVQEYNERQIRPQVYECICTNTEVTLSESLPQNLSNKKPVSIEAGIEVNKYNLTNKIFKI